MVGPLPIKLIIIGDSSVGKTSLLRRFSKGKYEFCPPSVTVDKDIVYVQTGKLQVQLEIYDTVGQERFRALTNDFYRHTDGVLLVYDVTRLETFIALSSWLDEIKSRCQDDDDGDDMSVIIVGNKKDEKKKAVTEKMVQDFAAENGYQHMETSAKDNINVEKVFFSLLTEILQKQKLLDPSSNPEMSVISKEAVKKSTDNFRSVPNTLPTGRLNDISLKLFKYRESDHVKIESSSTQTPEKKGFFSYFSSCRC